MRLSILNPKQPHRIRTHRISYRAKASTPRYENRKHMPRCPYCHSSTELFVLAEKSPESRQPGRILSKIENLRFRANVAPIPARMCCSCLDSLPVGQVARQAVSSRLLNTTVGARSSRSIL